MDKGNLREPGLWWASHDPKTEWTGTLTFDSEAGASLSLIEKIEPEDAVDTLRRRTSGEVGRYDVIHGTNVRGTRISLLQCFDRSSVSNLLLGRVATREIFVNRVLHGIHAKSSDPKFTRAVVVLRHLSEWFGRSGLSIGDLDDRAPIEYCPPDAVTLVRDKSFSVVVHPLRTLEIKSTMKGHAASIEENVFLVVETPDLQPMSYFQDIISACQDLLSIACQNYCQIESLCFERGGNSQREVAEFHAVPNISEPPPKSAVISDALVLRSDRIGDWQEAFTRWVEERDASRPIRGLYNAAMYTKNPREARFLAYAQAVEAFHRRFRGGVYMDEEEWRNEILPTLTEAVPESLDMAHRDSLKTTIKYGNEYSLRKRLKCLTAEHKKALEKLVPDAEDLCGKIVELRNRFTHWPLEGEGDVSAEDFWRYEFMLRVLLELSFLSQAGFSPDEIAELANDCQNYQSWGNVFRGRAKKH